MTRLWALPLVLLVFVTDCRSEVTADSKSNSASEATLTQSQPRNKSIPLHSIWAWRMPDTKPMIASRRDGAYLSREGSILDEIRRALSHKPSGDSGAGQGFVVTGNEIEALKEVRTILVEAEKPQYVFQQGIELSAVFFSYQSDRYVHIRKVEISRTIIEIEYQFVPHQTRETTEHIALIPLGELPPGTYEVHIRQIPLVGLDRGYREINDEGARRIVCRSFSFVIRERK